MQWTMQKDVQQNWSQFCYPCPDVLQCAWLVATNLFRVLKQARHCIKTGYGISQPVYGNEDEDKPIAGIGQGNGLGPLLWCLTSTIIIKKCKRKGHGTTITITTPISKKGGLSPKICLCQWCRLSYCCQQRLHIRCGVDPKDASSYDRLVRLYLCHRWTHRPY